MNAIFTRRSIRHFLDKEVEQEKVEKILQAAMQAPSACNGQPWEFIVVRGKENLEALSKYSPYAGSLKKANVGIVVLGNTQKTPYPDYLQQDLGAATQNILLQATELGLGTCWFGTCPDKARMDYLSKLYQLENHLMPFCVISLGYPDKENANHFVNRFNPSAIRYIG